MTRGDRERLRAELAGKAMHAIISTHLEVALTTAKNLGIAGEQVAAQISIGYADALLAELDRTAEDPIKAGGTE